MNGEYTGIFRERPAPEPIFRCHMAVLAWYVACQYTYTEQFAADLERDIRAAYIRTQQPGYQAERAARWQQWQREQGR